MVGLGAAVLSTLVAGFAWGFLRESRRAPTVGGAPTIASGRSAVAHVLSRWNEPAPRLIWLYAVAIGAFYGTIQTVPLLLQARLGVTERTVGYFVMYLGGMGVVVRSLILGRAVDRLGEARLTRVGIVCLAAGLALTGATRSHAALFAGFTLMPIGTAFSRHTLKPLYAPGLCEAVIIAPPAARNVAVAKYRIGVDTRPMSITSAPSPRSPDTNASRSASALWRMS